MNGRNPNEPLIPVDLTVATASTDDATDIDIEKLKLEAQEVLNISLDSPSTTYTMHSSDKHLLQFSHMHSTSGHRSFSLPL